ncbi:disease resistance protein RPV1-like [Prosopis cineraria]|uniref:disease resistance protein RPV1-like n=1 Tax=Prosopis cineraria TaxID=364024 RepID=UPI00240F6D5A|nr:disease resistance protein RPV1-like [Prosopis cineraria]
MRTWKYEVFISFRGDDTRKGFTANLFSALERKGIFAFRDDRQLQKGDSISGELVKAIKQSRIHIVVFSKRFADSTWCVEELANISELIFFESGYTVIPVFYDVDPSEVQHQSGNFKEAFDIHEQNFSDNIDKVQRWRLALTQVATLPGWDVRNKSEKEIIDNIVNKAISELGHRFSSLADDLVGMQSHVEALENLLNLESSNDVRFVGITGIPGIGKTTLAAVVYDRISYQFDASCFLHNVSEAYIVHLQQQLLSEILKTNVRVRNTYEGRNIMSWKLSNLKSLVVVDNINSLSQLENLVGRLAWFGQGSRIIITTRYEHILYHHTHQVSKVYRVELLKDHEALQLLCLKAFNCDYPLNDFRELTHGVLQYAKALPLAIKVFGSHLIGKQESEWRTELERLKEIPNRDVMKFLQRSYDELDELKKEIFLDIACFFNGANVNYVANILQYHGFVLEYGIRLLHDRSLISIVNGTLWMHDLLQELGRKIVHEQSIKHSKKRSRLWSYLDLRDINRGMENVEAIVLNQEVGSESPLKAEVLSQMSYLKLLILPPMKFSGNLNDLSNQLRYLSWPRYPFNYLPSRFNPKYLIELIMSDSEIRYLWEGKKSLPCLRSIDLHGSKSLVETPDLSGAVNLKKLNLEGCIGLLQVHASIGDLNKLLFLNMRNCSNLICIPSSLFLLRSLETFNLCHCSRLREIFQVKDL